MLVFIDEKVEFYTVSDVACVPKFQIVTIKMKKGDHSVRFYVREYTPGNEKSKRWALKSMPE